MDKFCHVFLNAFDNTGGAHEFEVMPLLGNYVFMTRVNVDMGRKQDSVSSSLSSCKEA